MTGRSKLMRMLFLLPAFLMLAAASRHAYAWMLCPSDPPAESRSSDHGCCNPKKDAPGSGHDCCKLQQSTPAVSGSLDALWDDLPFGDLVGPVEELIVLAKIEADVEILFASDSSPPNLCTYAFGSRAPPVR